MWNSTVTSQNSKKNDRKNLDPSNQNSAPVLFLQARYLAASHSKREILKNGKANVYGTGILPHIVLFSRDDRELVKCEGHFTPSKKRTRFFQNKRIFTDF